METTENLALPYIMPSQAQKHVTHNEAIRMLDALVHLSIADRDLSVPPDTPAAGARYIVGPNPSGLWSGRHDAIAAWQDGAWSFLAPRAGWLAWIEDENLLCHYLPGNGWTPALAGAGLSPRGAWSAGLTYDLGDLVEHEGHAFLSNADGNAGHEPDAYGPGSTAHWTLLALGAAASPLQDDATFRTLAVNESAGGDTVNRLRVASPASLFDHEEGTGHRLKINKQNAAGTCSVLFQTDYAGHAEFGLTGDNDWHVKVSPDGETWHEALTVDRATGTVSFPNSTFDAGSAGGGRELLADDRTYYVRTDGDDANDGLSDTAGGAFRTIQKAVDTVAGAIDAAGRTVTIRLGEGTYTAPVTLRNAVGFGGAGTMIIRGDAAAPGSVTVSTDGVSTFFAEGLYTVWDILDLTIETASSGSCLEMRTSEVRFGNVVFGPSFTAHLHLLGSTATAVDNYAVAGGATRHVICHNSSFFNSANRAVTFSGTPAFALRTYECRYNSVCFLYGMSFPGSGVTGPRYLAGEGAVIYTAGGATGYLPGDEAGEGTDFGSAPWGLYK